MNSEQGPFGRLADEMEQEMWGRLSSIKGSTATQTSSGPPREVAGRRLVVVVEVPAGAVPPGRDDVKEALAVAGAAIEGDPDIYWLVDKPWTARGPRELNPLDPQRGREEQLFLSSLRPDFFLKSPGGSLSFQVEGAIVIDLPDD